MVNDTPHVFEESMAWWDEMYSLCLCEKEASDPVHLDEHGHLLEEDTD